MAFQELTKTPAPVAGLVDGTTYQGEVKSNSVVYFLPASTAPTVADYREASEIRPTDFDRRFGIEKTAGVDMYIWAGDGPEPAGIIQYSEA